MKNKKYNTILLQIFISIIIVISLINYVIDPYYVFNTQNKLNKERKYKDKNHRFSKIPAFKLYKKDVCKIWTGSSKSWEGTNEEYESKISGCQVKNLAVSGSNFEEAINMAKNAMIIHPEIKTIYLGIAFSMMQKAAHKKNLKIIKTTPLAKEELIPLILSLDTFKDSVRTINYNLKQKNKKIVKYGEERENNKRYLYKFKNSIHLYNEEHYKNYTIDDNYFNELKELIEYAKSKNINVVFYTTTMHITERILIDNTNNSDNFNKVKEKLAEIQPYYDFAIVDQYTTEKLSSDMKCFRDSVHNKPF